ncbi:MAG: hypothetical protein A2177_13365 [Spirochaetes bacterium RBG_13_68_11]|nr:MAG: hypothetical protein A2177_13365 [Spirochaetes bacterium RBG_13_68_11]
MAAEKVVITLGSPREKGNSSLLAERAADGVRDAGGEPVTFPLHTMAIWPCRGCDACQRNKDYRCVHPDDMAAIYTALREAGGLLIASPVYWFTMSAQTKLFIYRLYAFVGPSGWGLAGKRIGIALAYADPDPFVSGAVNALRTFQDAFRHVGAPIVGMVYGRAWARGSPPLTRRAGGESSARSSRSGRSAG